MYRILKVTRGDGAEYFLVQKKWMWFWTTLCYSFRSSLGEFWLFPNRFEYIFSNKTWADEKVAELKLLDMAATIVKQEVV